jgi:hypothetical protein
MELRDSLEELGRKIGYNFNNQIGLIEVDIAERTVEPETLAEGEGIPKRATLAHDEVLTDDDVRQMFSTLEFE